MATQEEQANAQLRRIPLAQGGGMGIYATEDIWHGQEIMLVNQEQTNDPEEDSRHSLVEERAESRVGRRWEPTGPGGRHRRPSRASSDVDFYFTLRLP